LELCAIQEGLSSGCLTWRKAYCVKNEGGWTAQKNYLNGKSGGERINFIDDPKYDIIGLETDSSIRLRVTLGKPDEGGIRIGCVVLGREISVLLDIDLSKGNGGQVRQLYESFVEWCKNIIRLLVERNKGYVIGADIWSEVLGWGQASERCDVSEARM
jgi:hypothetical protein